MSNWPCPTPCLALLHFLAVRWSSSVQGYRHSNTHQCKMCHRAALTSFSMVYCFPGCLLVKFFVALHSFPLGTDSSEQVPLPLLLPKCLNAEWMVARPCYRTTTTLKVTSIDVSGNLLWENICLVLVITPNFCLLFRHSGKFCKYAASVLAADEGLCGQNVLFLFHYLLRPLLPSCSLLQMCADSRKK